MKRLWTPAHHEQHSISVRKQNLIENYDPNGNGNERQGNSSAEEILKS